VLVHAVMVGYVKYLLIFLYLFALFSLCCEKYFYRLFLGCFYILYNIKNCNNIKIVLITFGINPKRQKKSSLLEHLQIRLNTPMQLVVSGVYIPRKSELVMRDFFKESFPSNERANATVTLGDFNMHTNVCRGQRIIAVIEI